MLTDPSFQMKEYATKLEEILFLDGDGGHNTASRVEMEAGLRNIKHLLDSLQHDTEKLTGTSGWWEFLLNIEQFDNLSVVGRTGGEAARASFFYKHNSNGQQATCPQHCDKREPHPTTTSVIQQEHGKGPESVEGDQRETGPGQGRPQIGCKATESHNAAS